MVKIAVSEDFVLAETILYLLRVILLPNTTFFGKPSDFT